MVEVEVIYKDLSSQKVPLGHDLQLTNVQYIIVWKDDLILREKFGSDYYYLIWTKDWLALEGYDRNEVDKVFYNLEEPNKVENREYFDISLMGIKHFPNRLIFETPETSSEEDWKLALEKVREIKNGVR